METFDVDAESAGVSLRMDRDEESPDGDAPSTGEEDGIPFEVRITRSGQFQFSYEFVWPFLQERLAWKGMRGAPTRKPAASAKSMARAEPPKGPSSDTYIDQRSGLVDKAIFLRLAREKAFPSKRIGKRVVARWADVQAALSPSPSRRSSVNDNEDCDPELDEIRARVGLAVRGRR